MTIKKELSDLEAKVTKGLKIAHTKMIEFKKFKKTPIVISQNGKVIEVTPEEMALETEKWNILFFKTNRVPTK